MNTTNKVKYSNFEDLYKELNTLNHLPKNSWIERVNTLGIKQLLNSNKSLLISNPDKSLEQLYQLKTRLKKIPSQNNDSQSANLKTLHDLIEILANLSEDEESAPLLDIDTVCKELERLRKLPKEQWHEHINNLYIKQLINKNLNILLDHGQKALPKLSQILSRLTKEPSPNKEEQDKVLHTISRAIDLTSHETDDEDAQEESSSDSSNYVSSVPTTTAAPSTQTTISSFTTSQNISSPSYMETPKEILPLKIPTRPEPLKGTPKEAVEYAIKNQLEYVDLTPCEQINELNDLCERDLERLFNENPNMKALWLVECPNISMLPINNRGYALKALYCHHMPNLKYIPYNCYPRLEILDINWCQNVAQLPPPSGFLRALSIEGCIQFDIDLSSKHMRQMYPNLSQYNQRDTNNPGLHLTPAEIDLQEEITNYCKNFELDPNKSYTSEEAWIEEMELGVEEIKQKWKTRFELYENKQLKEAKIEDHKRLRKRYFTRSADEELDLKAKAEGRPKYWRKIDFVAQIIESIPSHQIQFLEKTYASQPERMYDAMIDLWKRTKPLEVETWTDELAKIYPKQQRKAVQNTEPLRIPSRLSKTVVKTYNGMEIVAKYYHKTPPIPDAVKEDLKAIQALENPKTPLIIDNKPLNNKRAIKTREALLLESLLKLSSFCDFREIIRLSAVSKTFAQLTKQDSVWRMIATKYNLSDAANAKDGTIQKLCIQALSYMQIGNAKLGKLTNLKLAPKLPAFENELQGYKPENFKLLSATEAQQLMYNKNTVAFMQSKAVQELFAPKAQAIHHIAHQKKGLWTIDILNFTPYVLSLNEIRNLHINGKPTNVIIAGYHAQLMAVISNTLFHVLIKTKGKNEYMHFKLISYELDNLKNAQTIRLIQHN